MKHFSRLALGLSLALSFTAGFAQATTIASWTFETSLPTSAGPFAPEVGAGAASGFHISVQAAYSNPVGNGSTESFSSDRWFVGDYYQFQVSSTGLQNIALSWDQTRSATGPQIFSLDYSTNGSTFTPFTPYVLSPITWSSVSVNPASALSFDLSSVSALNNQANVLFRLVSGITVAAPGTSRVDNFTVTGSAVVASNVPEPATITLLALAAPMLLAARRRNIR